MAIHTFRYRYTAEVEITVSDLRAPKQQEEEVADQALAKHGDRMVEVDPLGLVGKQALGPGVTGEVVKIGTWGRI